MNSTNRGAAYLESRILSADPIELIAILYEHGLLAVRDARECVANRDIAGRSRSIAKAIAIVGELDSSLNHSEGGEISVNLSRLYQYIRERLTAANLRQEDGPLAEVERLLNTLAEAWDEVKRSGPSPAPAVSNHAPPPPVAAPVYEAPRFSTPFVPAAELSPSSHSWMA